MSDKVKCENCKHWRTRYQKQWTGRRPWWKFWVKQEFDETTVELLYGNCVINPRWEIIARDHYCSKFEEKK